MGETGFEEARRGGAFFCLIRLWCCGAANRRFLSPFDYAQGAEGQQKNRQRQIQGSFAALRMTNQLGAAIGMTTQLGATIRMTAVMGMDDVHEGRKQQR